MATEEVSGVHERVAKIEGVIGQMSDRLNHVEDQMVTRTQAEQMNRRLSHLESMSLWTLGIVVTSWLTVLVSIWLK